MPFCNTYEALLDHKSKQSVEMTCKPKSTNKNQNKFSDKDHNGESAEFNF